MYRKIGIASQFSIYRTPKKCIKKGKKYLKLDFSRKSSSKTNIRIFLEIIKALAYIEIYIICAHVPLFIRERRQILENY